LLRSPPRSSLRSSQFLPSYFGLIAGDEFGKSAPSGWDEEEEDAHEDEFISLDSPPRSNHQGGRGKGSASDPGSMMSPSTAVLGGRCEGFRRDIFSALNDVGWRRVDVYGYGHDQMIEEVRTEHIRSK